METLKFDFFLKFEIEFWLVLKSWNHLSFVNISPALLCLPSSVTGEVYCFPRCQLIFSFDRRARVILHHACFKSIPSVCTTILKRIAWLHFYPKSFMLYTNGLVSTSSTNEWKAVFKLRVRFWIFGRKMKSFLKNSEAWILIKLHCVIYQWIRFNEIYKLMKSFSNFELFFELLAKNRKMFNE